MHGKGEVALTLGGKYTSRGKARVIDKQWIIIADPFCRVWGIRDNGIKGLVIPMIRFEKCVAVVNVEIGIVDVVEEHVDTTEVVGRNI